MTTCPIHPTEKLYGVHCTSCLIDGPKAENAKLVKTREALERLLADVTDSPVAQAEQFIRERSKI